MYVFSLTPENYKQKVGLKLGIYPTHEALPAGGIVHVSTEKGHETVIRLTEQTMTYFVIKGEGIFMIDSEDYSVKEKDLIVIPPQKVFTYTGKMELLLLSTPSWREESEETLGRNEKYDTYIPPEASSELSTLQNALARSQADYQNLVMRVDRDKADMVHFLSAKILLPLLTQVDNLERAVKLKEGVEGDGFVEGIRSVLSGMQKFLENQGVKAFDSVGQEVNPERHDVMTEMPGEAGKIIQEFEKGYLLGDRVLRHAKVVVGNGN